MFASWSRQRLFFVLLCTPFLFHCCKGDDLQYLSQIQWTLCCHIAGKVLFMLFFAWNVRQSIWNSWKYSDAPAFHRSIFRVCALKSKFSIFSIVAALIVEVFFCAFFCFESCVMGRKSVNTTVLAYQIKN